ncbi:hypothetical protein [Mucilaginibacter antarcticus]|uniref:Uncharacterized protein n=1 Tax=Mucilaginibacter antarcticus TaxID=1855725 RepID=A0ABW5XSF0_9SPHI
MKSIMLTLTLILILQAVVAQNKSPNGDIKVRVTYSDADDHSFMIDVDIKDDLANITYLSYDSIRFEKVRKDPQYQDINKRIYTYKNDNPKYNLARDTLGKIFERHRIYTRDTKKVNLKNDTTFRNLLNRILTASKDELSPDINANNKTPGVYIITTREATNFNLVIVSPTGKRSIPVDIPMANTNPILFSFIKSSLSKKPNSSAVKNILKFYSWYK